MSHAAGLAVLFGVVRYLQRNSIPRGGDKQSEGEAMAATPRVLVLLVAAPLFPLAARFVAGAIGVLGALSRLADQRGVDDQEKRPPPRFELQESLAGRIVQVVLLPPLTG